MNGASLVPLFDGWPFPDATGIDTKVRIDAMDTALTTAGVVGTKSIKIFHANFDASHGVPPKEWALGGSKKAAA
jgi:hypothetical protein